MPGLGASPQWFPFTAHRACMDGAWALQSSVTDSGQASGEGERSYCPSASVSLPSAQGSCRLFPGPLMQRDLIPGIGLIGLQGPGTPLPLESPGLSPYIPALPGSPPSGLSQRWSSLWLPFSQSAGLWTQSRAPNDSVFSPVEDKMAGESCGVGVIWLGERDSEGGW